MEVPSRIESLIIRSAIGNPPEPPVDLFKVADRLGIQVERATEYRDGYTDFREQRPVIFLNQEDSGIRMRFILAHEIAHVILHAPRTRYILDMADRAALLRNEEELADRIGAAILIPDGWLRTLRNVRYTLAGLERVARLADVPLATLIERMSAAHIHVALLQWQKARSAWHIIHRPGAPSCLHGHFELSEFSKGEFENLSDTEGAVTIDGSVDRRRVTISGLAYRRGQEVSMLIGPSSEIW
jgi:Zn-dependent peptidase ImmA (M78 family)